MSNNLLLNPGFELSFRNVDGVGELTVAESWWPWYVEGGASESKNPFRRPEYKPEVPNVGRGRIKEGLKGQKQFTTYGAQYAGIYQVVNVTPGSWYQMMAWGYAWSTGEDNPDVSPPPNGKLSMKVGINPWGRTDPPHRTTVWGREIMDKYNAWYAVSVVAQAWSEKVTAILGCIAEHPIKHNDIYWDSAAFFLLGSSVTPPPEPEPTDLTLAAVEAAMHRIVREEIDGTIISLGRLG